MTVEVATLLDLKSLPTPAFEQQLDWPKPEALQSELPLVQGFSIDLLPGSFRALVSDLAERMQVPMDYPAAVVMLCLAGAVNRRARIQPKANDNGWIEVPNLWGGIVAPPGFMKSPVIHACTEPLNQIQSEWRRQHEEEQVEYEHLKEEHAIKHAAWKEDAKAKTKAGKAMPQRPSGEPATPRRKRLIVNDATFEAIHATMSENPAGIFLIRDELTGWLSQLDRPGREGERAFALEAWNGKTGHTIDRIGRGTIHVEACCMSLLGGIQPGRLRSYLADALKDGPSNDGLIQRFQVLVWPDAESGFEYVDRPANRQSENQAASIFKALLDLNENDFKLYRFEEKGQAVFIDWIKTLEPRVRGNELHPALASHLSKYRSLMPSLALLFELCEWASGGGSPDRVSMANTERAVAWCEYLESHARRVYSCVVSPQIRAARELAEKIKTRKVGSAGYFCCRDVYLKGWSGLDSPEAVRKATEVLEDAGWIRANQGETGASGGRPSHRYDVNPAVLA